MERAGVRSNMFAQVEADAYRRITVFVVVVVDTLAGGGTEGGGGGNRCTMRGHSLQDHRPSHPCNAGMEHVEVSPTRTRATIEARPLFF